MAAEEMGSYAISIDNVMKNYNGAERPAVNGLSLKIQTGEIYGLLGPNGAGKSTTVMMICGLLLPDSGSIKVFDINPATNGSVARSKIGVATQEIALFPSLTAMENLNYLTRIYGHKPDKSKIEGLIDRFGLKSKAHKQVTSYSGGMKRRLNLIASVLHDPELLILDEPTAGVDVQSRSMIVEYLQEMNKLGMTIIYSSHILEEAERLCHRVGIISEGKLLEEGTTQDLIKKFNADSLESVFLSVSGKSIKS
jgi:ABC-2 type transport system ATP-binding protein